MFRSLTAVTSPYFLVMWSSVTPAMDRFSSLPAWGGAKVSCSRGSHAGYSITPWLLGPGSWALGRWAGTLGPGLLRRGSWVRGPRRWQDTGPAGRRQFILDPD